MAKTNWKKKILITNNLQQQILGYHVKFKVCLVSKPLIHVVLSNFCKLREKHFFCRLFNRNLEFSSYIMWIIRPCVTVVCLSVQLWLVIQTFALIISDIMLNLIQLIAYCLQDYILDELKSSDVPLPKVITTEFTSSERYILYHEMTPCCFLINICFYDGIDIKLKTYILLGGYC